MYDYSSNHYLVKIKSMFAIIIIANEFISPRPIKLAASLVDQRRLGPNTMARLRALILFTSSCART